MEDSEEEEEAESQSVGREGGKNNEKETSSSFMSDCTMAHSRCVISDEANER